MFRWLSKCREKPTLLGVETGYFTPMENHPSAMSAPMYWFYRYKDKYSIAVGHSNEEHPLTDAEKLLDNWQLFYLLKQRHTPELVERDEREDGLYKFIEGDGI